jgi:selenocysteine lyase/cysteine desulfurase
MATRRNFIHAASWLTGLSLTPLTGFAKSPSLDLLVDDKPADPFQAIREQLLVPPSRVYLNTGSLGPSPRPVIDAFIQALQQLESNPVGENWGPLGEQMELVRAKLAGFLNADKDEILLTRNTTEGLSLIGQSLALQEGDEILTTTLEHGGGEVGLEFLQKTKGAVIRKIEFPLPCQSKEEAIRTVESSITPKTKLMMLSHVNTVTGMIMPLQEVAAITRPKGIFLVVDGAQAPGQIKIDLKQSTVDAYASSGHKWLMGPKETGFLYLRKDFQPHVKPVFSSSGFAAYSASSGTRNVASFIALGKAIEWHDTIGVEKTRQRCAELRDYALSELKKVKGIHIISPEDTELASAMVSFSLEKANNTTVFNQLKEKDIIVKHLSQHNALRISCHLFVTRKDIDQFVTALKELV